MEKRVLQITGTGTLKVVPDQVIITLPVEAHAMAFSDASELLNRKTSVLRTAIKSHNISSKELKTAQYSITEDWRYERESSTSIFNGFKASHRLKITLPLDNKLISDVLQSISASNNDITFQLSFDVADKEKYKDELIKKAIADATSSAKVIAASANVTLKQIQRIDYSFGELRIYDNVLMEADYNTKMDAMEINPEEQSFEKTITVVWEID